MIEEVKDFFGDVKDKVGGKGFVAIILVLVGVFLYNLLKNENGGDDTVYYTPSGVAGYPGLEQNADVVIDTLTQNMQGYYDEMLNVMKEHDEDSTSSILGALTDSESNIKGSIDDAKDELTENMGLGFDSVHLGFETVENYINDSMSKVEDLSSKIDNIDTSPRVEYVTNYVPVYNDGKIMNKLDELGTGQDKLHDKADQIIDIVSVKEKPEETPNVYEFKTKSGLNTNTSIVDALKATGVDSSMSNRRKIAEANGITNYNGSYSQNVQMLNKLKAGELKKAN